LAVAEARGTNELPPSAAARYTPLDVLIRGVATAAMGSRDRLLGELYTAMPPRRLEDYQLMRVVQEEGDAKSNWLVVGENPLKFVFNVYKTAKEYGRTVLVVNRTVRRAIKAYLDQHDVEDGELLIPGRHGPLTGFSTVVTDALERMTGKRVNLNLLRRAYITHADEQAFALGGQRSKGDRRKMAKAMGHSVETSLDYNVRRPGSAVAAAAPAPAPAAAPAPPRRPTPPIGTRAATCPVCEAAVAPSKRARVAAIGACAKKAKCL
jgi:hypothetical protein